MSTLVRTWVFAVDAEGLADKGDASNIAFAYEGSDGSPANGSVKFTSAGTTSQTEKARRASTGQTWESWGLPPGATITAVQITAWNRKVQSLTLGDTLSLKARIIDSSGSSIHAAGELLSLGFTVAGAWGAGSAGTSRSIDAGKQASTTDVRLELECTVDTGGVANAVDLRLDTIELTITYTDPPPASCDQSVSKIFTFDSDAEGMEDLAASSVILGSRNSGDGSPTNGCWAFTTTQANLATPSYERGRTYPSATNQTWESWGVPAGAVVNSVQCVGYRAKRASDTGLTLLAFSIRVVANQGTTVHSAGDLISSDLSGLAAGWNTRPQGAQRAVDATYQASNSGVHLELEWSVNTGASANVDHRFDYIQLTICYTLSIDLPPSQSPPDDWDIRLYDGPHPDGRRLTLPPPESCEFEILERGGYGAGSLVVPATWEEFQLSGNERVDVYLFGEFMYRGFVRIAENQVTSPERANPALYGLIQKLDSYRANGRYAYGTSVDISVVFEDIVNDLVKKTDKLPSVQIDTETIGVTINEFDCTGKTVAQALNALCDVARLQAVWGFDVDSEKRDQIYLRARSSSITRKYAVGGNVSGFVYPQNTEAIVNKLNPIRGGTTVQPNLVPNGSFEYPKPASLIIGNMLSDPSLEADTADFPWLFSGAADRYIVGGAGAGLGTPHSGTHWARIGNAGGGGAAGGIASNQAGHRIDPDKDYRLAVYVRRYDTTLAAQCRFVYTILDGSFTALATVNGSYVDGGTSYNEISITIDLSAYPTAAYLHPMKIESDPANPANSGVIVDDFSLRELGDAGIGQQHWKQSVFGVGRIDYIDWAYKASDAFHGLYSVRVKAKNIAVGTDYVEIRTHEGSRFPIVAGNRYTAVVRWRTLGLGSVSFRLGVAAQDADGGQVSQNDTDISGSPLVWTTNYLEFVPAETSVTAEFFILVLNNSEIVIDGLMLIPESVPSEVTSDDGWWEGEQYERIIDVENADLTGLASGVATSIDDYGIQEEEESQPGVTDYATALAFASGYFNAHALPLVQASLHIDGITANELLTPDGTVKVVNLPTAPDALFPARIHYDINVRVDMQVELGNEIGDLASLLQLSEARKRIR